MPLQGVSACTPCLPAAHRHTHPSEGVRPTPQQEKHLGHQHARPPAAAWRKQGSALLEGGASLGGGEVEEETENNNSPKKALSCLQMGTRHSPSVLRASSNPLCVAATRRSCGTSSRRPTTHAATWAYQRHARHPAHLPPTHSHCGLLPHTLCVHPDTVTRAGWKKQPRGAPQATMHCCNTRCACDRQETGATQQHPAPAHTHQHTC